MSFNAPIRQGTAYPREADWQGGGQRADSPRGRGWEAES